MAANILARGDGEMNDPVKLEIFTDYV